MKIATYQQLCLTLSGIVVFLAPENDRAVNHGVGTQLLLWNLMNLGPSVPVSSACMFVQIYQDGLLFRQTVFKPEVVLSSSRCSHLPLNPTQIPAVLRKGLCWYSSLFLEIVKWRAKSCCSLCSPIPDC